MNQSEINSILALPKKPERLVIYLPKPNDRAYDIQPLLDEFTKLFQTRKELVTEMSDLEDLLRVLYTTDVDPEEVDKFIRMVKGLKKGVARIRMHTLMIGGKVVGY